MVGREALVLGVLEGAVGELDRARFIIDLEVMAEVAEMRMMREVVRVSTSWTVWRCLCRTVELHGSVL